MQNMCCHIGQNYKTEKNTKERNDQRMKDLR